MLLPTTAGHSQAVVDWVASRVEFQVGGQGVVTPIGAVVTAATGVKNFDHRFCCLTA